MNPEYVTDVKPQKPEWSERHINLPPIVPPPAFTSPEYMAWCKEYASFSVHVSNFSFAKELEKNLWVAYKENNQEEIQKLLEQLRPLRVIPFEKRTPQEKWAHMMVQLPGDIGGPNKEKILDILSGRCHGRVLEAMCGFNSYIEPSADREVVALDYCREALERYPYPERTRILFDLNKIQNKKGIEFFSEGEFNTITTCFGFHYLHHPIVVFREFHRLLSRNGRLFLVENPHQCYKDMACRSFSPKICASFLRRTPFKDIHIEELPIAEDWELRSGGHYFLIVALKS